MPISAQQYELARYQAAYAAARANRVSHKITMTSTLRDRTPAPQPKPLDEGQFKWGKTSSFSAGEKKQRPPMAGTTPTVHYTFDNLFSSSEDRWAVSTSTTVGPDERITGNEPQLGAVQEQNIVDPADFDALYIDPGPDGIVGTPDDVLIDPGPTEETRNLLKSVGQVDQWIEVWRREKQVRITQESNPDNYVDVMKVVSMVFKTPDPAPDGGQRFVKLNFQKTSDIPIPTGSPN